MIKKFLIPCIVSILTFGAMASEYHHVSVNDCTPAAMRGALDQAAAKSRAVVTVVSCDHKISQTDAGANRGTAVRAANAPVGIVAAQGACGADVIERVVDRQVYVVERVQRYRPVIAYIPDGEYVRVCGACGR